MRPPDPTPLLRLRYRTFIAITGRSVPVLRFGTLASWFFCHLCFSLGIEATGSCSSTRKPASDSRPLYAGRRLPSHQAPGRLVPGDRDAPGFDDGSVVNGASSKGSLAFVSLTLTCSWLSLNIVSNAHHRDSYPQQLGVDWDPLLT